MRVAPSYRVPVEGKIFLSKSQESIVACRSSDEALNYCRPWKSERHV
jgi:hypothetical protein